MNITGKTAVVTGGASGLGLATARALTGAGGRVVIIDLPDSDGEVVAKELGEAARFAPADVTDETGVQAAIDLAQEAFEALHIAVNCAGVAFPGRVLSRDGKALELPRFEQVVRINLIGTFNVLRLAAAAMARNEPEDGEQRGDRQHCEHRRVRRTDRSSCLRCVEGRHRRHDPPPHREISPAGSSVALRSRPEPSTHRCLPGLRKRLVFGWRTRFPTPTALAAQRSMRLSSNTSSRTRCSMAK